MAILLQPTFWKNTTNLLRKGWLNLDAYINTIVSARGKVNVPYPFMGYPEAQFTESEDSFSYLNGPEHKKVKMKGMLEVYGSSSVYHYFGTVKVRPHVKNTQPWIWPGKLTGMIMASDNTNLFSPEYDKVLTPLAVGGLFYDIDASQYNPIDMLKLSLYEYGAPNPMDGSIDYALVLEMTTLVPTSDLQNALINYEFEFIVPKETDVTLWQD